MLCLSNQGLNLKSVSVIDKDYADTQASRHHILASQVRFRRLRPWSAERLIHKQRAWPVTALPAVGELAPVWMQLTVRLQIIQGNRAM